MGGRKGGIDGVMSDGGELETGTKGENEVVRRGKELEGGERLENRGN